MDELCACVWAQNICLSTLSSFPSCEFKKQKKFCLTATFNGTKEKKNTFALKTDLTTWVCGGFSPFLSMDWRLETIFTFIQEKDKHKHLQISSSSTNSACWCKILYYDFIYFRSRCDGIWVVVAESGIKALTSSSPYEILKKKRQHLQT